MFRDLFEQRSPQQSVPFPLSIAAWQELKGRLKADSVAAPLSANGWKTVELKLHGDKSITISSITHKFQNLIRSVTIVAWRCHICGDLVSYTVLAG